MLSDGGAVSGEPCLSDVARLVPVEPPAAMHGQPVVPHHQIVDPPGMGIRQTARGSRTRSGRATASALAASGCLRSRRHALISSAAPQPRANQIAFRQRIPCLGRRSRSVYPWSAKGRAARAPRRQYRAATHAGSGCAQRRGPALEVGRRAACGVSIRRSAFLSRSLFRGLPSARHPARLL